MAKFFGACIGTLTWLGFVAVFPVWTLLLTGIAVTIWLFND